MKGTINPRSINVMPGPMKDLQGYLKEQDVQTLFDACRTNRERLIIRIFWKTGRRVGEVLMLKVKDIDFRARNIVWHIEKKNVIRKRIEETNEEFEIRKKQPKPAYTAVKPIGSGTIEMLRDYIFNEKLQPDDYVFYSPFLGKDKHLTRGRIFQIIRKIGERAGITMVGDKGLHPHHFRHSFAIHVLTNSNSPRGIALVQRVLEHSDPKITAGYLQFSQEDLREIIED